MSQESFITDKTATWWINALNVYKELVSQTRKNTNNSEEVLSKWIDLRWEEFNNLFGTSLMLGLMRWKNDLNYWRNVRAITIIRFIVIEVTW